MKSRHGSSAVPNLGYAAVNRQHTLVAYLSATLCVEGSPVEDHTTLLARGQARHELSVPNERNHPGAIGLELGVA